MSRKAVPLTQRIRPGSEAAPWVCLEIEELEARVAELEGATREAYEVWAGSDGIMRPATAPEAYVIRLIDQMATILAEAIKGDT